MITIKNLGVQFGSRSVLQDCNFEFADQEISVLLGPSGCGKSTVLKCIADLIPPHTGSIIKPHRPISFVFQEPRLLPWLSVRENILLPLHLKPGKNIPDPTAWMQLVGLENSQNLFPHQLSGGMKMRASIARALVTEPEVLLMDEPFSALDEILRYQLQDLILQIQRQRKLTLIFVTHSFSEAVYLGDRLFLMKPKGQGVALSKKNPVLKDQQVRLSGDYAQEVNFWSKELRSQSPRLEV